jgi:HD-GYP domain-containing protein (c-di-GMP phosphodiesterase class II)
VLVILGTAPTASTTWPAPELAFWSITVAAALCVAGAGWLVWLGHRRDLAEVGLLGAALVAISLLALVHGAATPGVFVGSNGAASLAACLALPAGLVVALPLLRRDAATARVVARHWRAWTAGWLIALGGLAAAILVFAASVPHAPAADSPVTVAGVAVTLAAARRLSWGQLHLYRVGRRPASLLTSIAVGELGVVTLAFVLPPDYSPAWWFAHALDVTFVLAVCVGVAVAYPRDRPFAELFAPVLSRDPVVALELGLAPEIRAFVAALGDKDEGTRLHVVRVAELATRLGERAGLSAEALRAVGLGGLLHDIGKLVVPDHILTKPAALTDDEVAVIQQHPVAGQQLLLGSPAADLLGPAARIVRWHHERYDGLGYPDGLAHHEIPTDVSLVSVADAWDAMTSTRHYRLGMSDTMAQRLLETGAGSQWDPAAVALLLEYLASTHGHRRPVLGQVGTATAEPSTFRPVVCADALPVALQGVASN